LKVQGSGDLTVFTLKLHSFLLTVRMLFHCVVTKFQYYIFLKLVKILEAIWSKFQKLFTINHMKFRGFQMDFRGSQMFFRGFSGCFRGVSNEISDGFQGGI